MSAFEQMVNHMINHNDTPLKVWSGKIPREEYEQWKKNFTWEALRGQRYGQSFCNCFGLHDNHLYYAIDNVNWADEYIKKTYIN